MSWMRNAIWLSSNLCRIHLQNFFVDLFYVFCAGFGFINPTIYAYVR